MKVSRYFVAGLPKPATPGRIEAAGVVGGGSPQPAFLTPQSLSSFPGASTAVAVVTRVLEAVADVKGAGVIVTVAIVIGAVVYLISISEPDVRPKNGIQWAVSGFIALLNAMFLAAAALGLLVVVDGAASASGGNGG